MRRHFHWPFGDPRLLSLFVTAALATLHSGGFAQEKSDSGLEAGSRWALLIGVDSYLDTRLGKLNYCGADALALSDLLVRQASFPEDQVIVMHDKQGDPVRRPLRMAIERTLQAFLAQPKAQDLVLITFSGHGTHVGDSSYLCPTDADMSQPTATMIPVASLYALLKNQCKATRKIVLVDACRKDPRSGPRAPGEVMPKGLSDSLRSVPEGLLVLSSCRAGQLSYEDEAVGHGVFMHYVIEGFSGRADLRGAGLRGNGDGVIDVDELFDYAAVQTKMFVLNRFTESQTPEMYGTKIGGTVDLVSNRIDLLRILQKATDATAGIDRASRCPILAEIAALHAQTGDQVRASTIFSDLTQQFRAQSHALVFIAESLVRSGNTKTAGDLLREALAHVQDLPEPSRTPTLARIASVRVRLGDFAGATQILQLLAADSWARNVACLALARAQARQKLFSDALHSAEGIPLSDRIDVMLQVAAAQSREKLTSDAESTLKLAYRIAEEERARSDRGEDKRNRSQASSALVAVHARLHEFDKAEETIEAIEMDTEAGCMALRFPPDIIPVEKRADRTCAFLCLAREYMREERGEAARAMFRKALSVANSTKNGPHYRANAIGRIALVQAEVGFGMDAYDTFVGVCEDIRREEADAMSKGRFGCFMSSGNPARLARLLTQYGLSKEAMQIVEMTHDSGERASIYIGIARGLLVRRGIIPATAVEDENP